MTRPLPPVLSRDRFERPGRVRQNNLSFRQDLTSPCFFDWLACGCRLTTSPFIWTFNLDEPVEETVRSLGKRRETTSQHLKEACVRRYEGAESGHNSEEAPEVVKVL